MNGRYDPILARAIALQKRANSPMGKVLARVPGKSIEARARRIGVSRQTYYNLQSGRNLPRADLVKRLVKLTGYTPEHIRLSAAAARAALVAPGAR
jgi:DNA-binding XRE family transcriptional regulator